MQGHLKWRKHNCVCMRASVCIFCVCVCVGYPCSGVHKQLRFSNPVKISSNSMLDTVKSREHVSDLSNQSLWFNHSTIRQNQVIQLRCMSQDDRKQHTLRWNSLSSSCRYLPGEERRLAGRWIRGIPQRLCGILFFSMAFLLHLMWMFLV